MQVSMTMQDPEKAAILGVKPGKTDAKLSNPFYQATELDKIGKHKEAEHLYSELLNADFTNSAVMAALGMNYAITERNALSCLLLKTALSNVDNILGDFKKIGIIAKTTSKADEDSFVNVKRSEIMNAIGTCYKHENNCPVAREWFEKAQAGLPINPDIQNNMGTLYINEGKPEDALRHLNLALSVSPEHAQAHWNKSLALLEMGDYVQGWPEYDYGFPANVRHERNFSDSTIPTWDGTPGKSIIVYGEQGIGDEILFASCLQELIGMSKLVVFECHKKLHHLFANSFPTIDIYPTREDPQISWPVKQDGTKRYNFDAKIAIGSLPRYFRQDISKFPGVPFITPTVKSEADWTIRLNKLGPKPKIGIGWIGGHKRTRVEVRSMHLEQLLPILKQDADFISLQYTPCEDELAEFERVHGIHIHHFPEACYSPNYDDKAGLVANLDLVITVCTSAVHLAGSMGVPTWVMTPSRPAWRYRLDLDYMPWYGKTVTLFRQAEITTDWTPVVTEVSEALSELLTAKAPS